MSRPVATCAAAFAAAAISTIAMAQAPIEPGFDVFNSSAVAITHVVAKPDGSPSWGVPLPSSAVAAGKTGRIKLASETNCFYDVRLVFADRHVEEHEKVDVCKHSRIESGKQARQLAPAQ
jgi:hypothetical protein